MRAASADALASPAAATTMLATYHGDLARTGFDVDRVLDQSDVKQLHVLWKDNAHAVISAQPAVVGAVTYWGDWAGYEHATIGGGETLWSTYLGTTTVASCKPSSAGVASSATVGTMYGVPVVWTGTGDGAVAALDAGTGRILWRRHIAPPGGFIWSSPALSGDSIFIGVSSFGDCPLVQGRVVKLNAVTGALEAAVATAPAGCLGSGVWSSPALDGDGNLYVTTGNAGCSTPYADALLKLSTTTLHIEDSWQIPASGQIADGDWGATPTIFSATIHGATTQLVGAVDKNGIFYTLRASSLRWGPLWQQRIAAPGNCPQCDGGSIAPAAFDGSSLYAGGGSVAINSVRCAGSVAALNPATGAFRWRRCLGGGPVLGALTAVPGIVFATAGPQLIAFNAGTGAALYTYNELGGAWFYGPCTVAQGTVYAGNTDGMLSALSSA